MALPELESVQNATRRGAALLRPATSPLQWTWKQPNVVRLLVARQFYCRAKLVLPTLLVVMLLSGCIPQPLPPATPTKTPDPGTLNSAYPTPIPTIEVIIGQLPTGSPLPADPSAIPTLVSPTASSETPTPTALEAATDTPPPPTLDAALPADHYVMTRPIPQGWRDFLDRTYAYGATAGGKYRPHAGGDFPNPETTPVVAVGNAVVEYAGADAETVFGPQPDFYGNLVVIRLTDYTQNGQPVFALYGHLSQVLVQTGQPVPVGEILGAVGSTGVAAGGAHLHFEVRVGDPFDYFASTRNLDLWIKPYWGYGTLAGRVVDSAGNYFREVGLTIKGAEGVYYTWSYAGDENHPDEFWGENFTYGDLPEGWYTVTTRSSKRTYSFEVYIQPDRTTWLEIVFD